MSIIGEPGIVAASMRRAGGGGGGGYSAAVLADSPLLYLRFEETSGTTCANSGSLGGSATTTGTVLRNIPSATTNLGVGVDLEGVGNDDYIDFNDAGNALNITGDVTYECWTRFDTFAPAVQYMMHRGNDSSTNGNYAFDIDSTRAFRARHAGVSILLSSGAGGYPNDTTNWHHIAFTRIGNAYVIYLDGASVASGSNSEAVQVTTLTKFRVGASQTSFAPSGGMNGLIDEVAVYGSGLSSTRIAAHYAAR
jgi:hypothetical protein